MKNRKYLLAFLLLMLSFLSQTFAQVHTSYLWHLQQPIYWPAQSTFDTLQYQTVYESHWHKMNSGAAHPENDLYDIFSKADRVAVYQHRAKDAVQSLLSYPEGGAQVNYSGCLIQNINSLASNSQWGYSNGWENNFVTARGWTTSSNKPRMDIVGFTMHHALSPLLSEEVLRKQIQAHRHIYTETFGISPDYSNGYWPAECAFSERIIKVLVQEGFEWSVIANSHLARTLSDYPLNFGTAGCNLDPPNKADKVPATGTNWWSGQIDGRGGAFAAPYCYQAHKAKYVDPASGTEYLITVVPMCDLLSYQNGYALMGTGDIDANIAPYNNAAHPSIVLMAHDGDNAWGGGYDYYTNSVSGFAALASAQGYVPTTIEQFLSDHPVPANDMVHVEDGAWINAANDWGHPQFINWIWPMHTSSQEFDTNGWNEDARNWAVLVAAENLVMMAEDIEGTASISEVVEPTTNATHSERAWHHLLPGYTSGYMYYGTSLDMEVKQTVACNKATELAGTVMASYFGPDNTPPSVFITQRYPYNPGGTGFGPNYSYQQYQNSPDFHVWTFAFDYSGIQSAVLKYRLDDDGVNPLTDNDNDTYVGGSGVGSWNSINMTMRQFPAGNYTNNPDIDFFVMPNFIANQYYAEISGYSDTLIDYYVEVTDLSGNTTKTAIQHVYVGSNTGTSSTDVVHWVPSNPTNADTITIILPNATQGGKLHWGNYFPPSTWLTPYQEYWPVGTSLFNGTGPAVETPLIGPSQDSLLTIQIGPFNAPLQPMATIAFVIHYDDNTWDNNNGADYHIPINNIIGIDPLVSEEKLMVYPNPATSEISIKIANQRSGGEAFDVEIMDVHGKVVLESKLLISRAIDVSELEAGVYFVRVSDGEDSKFVQRMVIVR